MFKSIKSAAAALSAIGLVAGGVSINASATFAQDEAEQPRTSYMVVYLKLKPGAGERWSELEDKYYTPAAKAAGLPAQEVHWMMDGPWNLMLLRPLPRGMASLDTHASPERDKFYKELIKIAGSEEAAKKIDEESEGLVTDSMRVFSHTHP